MTDIDPKRTSGSLPSSRDGRWNSGVGG